MAAKSKHRVEIKEKDGSTDEILIWFGEQCIFHFQRIADDRMGIDLYLTAHQHIDLASEAAITAQKDGPNKTLRKPSRHANMQSGKTEATNSAGETNATEPTSDQPSE